MKLLTYDNGTGPRCGVLQGDGVVDVTALLGNRGPYGTWERCWRWTSPP